MVPSPSIHGPCACRDWCGDVHQDEDDPSMPVCKGLPIRREPLVEIVLVRRDERFAQETFDLEAA